MQLNYIASLVFAAVFYLVATVYHVNVTGSNIGLWFLVLSSACAWASCYLMELAQSLDDLSAWKVFIFAASVGSMVTALLFAIMSMMLP